MTKIEDKPAGFFALVPQKDGILFLSKFYLKKDFRRKGIGRKQLEFIEKSGKDMGCQTIRLTVNRHNEGSIATYEHLGFHRVGEQMTDIGNGYVMDDYVMEKTI